MTMLAALWQARGLLGALAAAVLVGGLWLRLEAVAAQRDAAAGRLVEVGRANAASLDAIARMQADHAAQLRAVERTAVIERGLAARAAKIKETIAHEPATRGCGPVTDAGVEWLREQFGAAR